VVRLVLPCLLLGTVLLAASPGRAVTPGSPEAGCGEHLPPQVHDRAWWNKAASTCKYDFLVGTFDGMEAGSFLAQDHAGAPQPSEYDQHVEHQFHVNETRYFGAKGHVDLDRLVGMLDSYYRDPATKGMPVIGAMLLVSGKENGVPSSELKDAANAWSGWYD
jgi:hypothetical protein